MGRLCGDYDDQVLDLEMTDPHLLYVSVSPLKERELGTVDRAVPSDVPFEIGLPRAILDSSTTLGPYVQIVCNIKVWFDAIAVNLLVQGAPDLHEYGLHGASSAADKNLRLGKDLGLCRRGNPTLAARAQFQLNQSTSTVVARHDNCNRASQYSNLFRSSSHATREHPIRRCQSSHAVMSSILDKPIILPRSVGATGSLPPAGRLSRELALLLVDFPLLRAKNFLKHGGQISE